MSLSAVQICDFHIFTVIYSSLHGFIWNQHKDQLPAGLLAQLVEQCTGIARVMGPNPVQADNIFQALFSQLLKYCSLPRRSLSYSRLYPQFTYVIFIYIYSHLSLSLWSTSCTSSLFLTHFRVICDLLMNRGAATWNPLVNFITINYKNSLYTYLSFPSNPKTGKEKSISCEMFSTISLYVFLFRKVSLLV